MKKAMAIFCLLALLAPLPGLVMNRPSLRGDREENFTEAMGLRQPMLAANAFLSRLIGMSGSGQVTLGKEGTLFLTETLPQTVGAAEMTEEQIEAAARYLKALDDALRARGAYLVFLCAPNKATILPEKLPWYARGKTGKSDLDRLQRRLAEMGVTYLDARPLLLAEGDGAYLKTDTHWTDQGAYRVYRALMEALPEAEYETYEKAEMETVQRLGDLTELIDPGSGSREETIARALPRTYRAAGIMRTSMDQRIETHCDRNGLRIVMLRDSFAASLFPYLANNIGSLYLYRTEAWEESFWREGTDAVVLEIAERNLRRLADVAR